MYLLDEQDHPLGRLMGVEPHIGQAVAEESVRVVWASRHTASGRSRRSSPSSHILFSMAGRAMSRPAPSSARICAADSYLPASTSSTRLAHCSYTRALTPCAARYFLDGPRTRLRVVAQAIGSRSSGSRKGAPHPRKASPLVQLGVQRVALERRDASEELKVWVRRSRGVQTDKISSGLNDIHVGNIVTEVLPQEARRPQHNQPQAASRVTALRVTAMP
jgi:hypothetical protein